MHEKRKRIIELLGKINVLDDPEKALDEIIEECEDVIEFYTLRQNYKPEPLPPSEIITLRFEDNEQEGGE
jgi:hypothetical protein